MSRETLHWINFRESVAYISDGSNQQFLGNGTQTVVAYPVSLTYSAPVSATFNAGWGAAADGARNRSASVDPRLAGCHKADSGTGTKTLTVDLSSAGNWKLYLALGEAAVEGTKPVVRVYDNTTLLDTIDKSASGSAVGEFYDINGTLHTSAANWVSNQTGKQYTFATTTLKIQMDATSGSRSAIATLGMELLPAGPAITDVNTDEALSPGESITITGTGFGASQGAGGVAITQEAGAVSSAVTITGWADTSITGTVALGGLSYGATTSLVVTDNAAATGSIAVTFVPATGYSYVTLSGYPHATAYVVGDGASPALVDGDQVEYESTASSGAGVVVNADGSFVLDTEAPATFAYRVRDNTDNTWSSWASIRVNMPNQGGAGINLGIRIGV